MPDSFDATYLQNCLKEGFTVRWPDGAMPIKVYIAPFRWYEKSKQMESSAYRGMILKAMDTWTQVSGGKITFRLVNSLNDSQIDIKWRRVDRKSLGHCEYMIDNQCRLYSAEIQIGISDGLLHAKYNDPDEVQHTILHEFGHALGLVDHSDHPDDIMYVPHQYGVVNLSARDAETLQWLYRLPVGFNYQAIGKKYNLPAPFTMQDVLDEIGGKKRAKAKPSATPRPAKPSEKPEVLEEQHRILTDMGKFHLATQNIQIPGDMKKLMLQKKLKRPEDDI